MDAPPNDYKFDYVDSTEVETVLTEIKMEKMSRDHYRLPENEKKRIEKILDRALRVEKGVATADEVEEEALEDAMDLNESTGAEDGGKYYFFIRRAKGVDLAGVKWPHFNSSCKKCREWSNLVSVDLYDCIC